MTAEAEFEGKNVEEAVNKASDAMGRPPEQLSYDILSHGATGIFGLVGAKKAKIRVTDTRGEDASKHRPGKRSQEQIKEDILSTLDGSVAAAGNGDDTEITPVSEKKPSRWQPVPTAPITPEIITQSRAALERIAGAISEDARIDDQSTNGRLVLNLVGGNSGALIGKRGQTLEAIQYLVEKIVNKGRDDRVRVLVDVEGYLETRRSNLQQLAARMAEKVRKKGRPSSIGQMNAHDRRIVHMTLKDDTTVRTQSVGEGHFRKLVIYPRNVQPRRRKGAQSPSSRR